MYKHSKYENLNVVDELDKLNCEIEELKKSNNAKKDMCINAQNLEVKEHQAELIELKKQNKDSQKETTCLRKELRVLN